MASGTIFLSVWYDSNWDWTLISRDHWQTLYSFGQCNVKSKVKLVIVVEGNQKVPFSLASTPKCRGERYSFPWIAPLLPLVRTLYCWVLSKEVSSNHFLKSLVWRNLGLKPRSLGPLVKHCFIPCPLCVAKWLHVELKNLVCIFVYMLVEDF